MWSWKTQYGPSAFGQKCFHSGTEQSDGSEDRKEEGSREEKETSIHNITIPLIIFMLEHQFCSTIGEEGETTIWRQVTGISTRSSCSGILASLTLLMGKIDKLENLETKGIVLIT